MAKPLSQALLGTQRESQGPYSLGVLCLLGSQRPIKWACWWIYNDKLKCVLWGRSTVLQFWQTSCTKTGTGECFTEQETLHTWEAKERGVEMEECNALCKSLRVGEGLRVRRNYKDANVTAKLGWAWQWTQGNEPSAWTALEHWHAAGSEQNGLYMKNTCSFEDCQEYLNLVYRLHAEVIFYGLENIKFISCGFVFCFFFFAFLRWLLENFTLHLPFLSDSAVTACKAFLNPGKFFFFFPTLNTMGSTQRAPGQTNEKAAKKGCRDAAKNHVRPGKKPHSC